MKVVTDAGPLIAAFDRSDLRHKLSRRLLTRWARRLLVPDVVLAETDALIRTRSSIHAAHEFLRAVELGEPRRSPMTDSLFRRAIEYDAAYSDLDLGLGDASVMALAEHERAPILTFDFRDFRATRPLRGGFWRLVIDEDGRVQI